MLRIIESVKKISERTKDPSHPNWAFIDDTQRQSSGSDRPVMAVGSSGGQEGLLKEDQNIAGLRTHEGEIHEEAHSTQGEVNLEGLPNNSTSIQPSDHPIGPRPNITTHAGSFFQGAHDITIYQPVMMANAVSNEHEISALKHLATKANVDAALDSLARFPPPRCHEATRRSLLGQAKKWLADLDRESPLLWLFGPAGSGKSAIAQTIGEYCQERGWLGSTFFFSRPNKRNDPNRVIPSLVHQLAIVNPTYRQAVTQLLTLDPTILEKARHVQFDQLIAKPAMNFRIQSSESDNQSHPILMLLDGLDECDTDKAQREFIRLIAAFSGTCKRLRLPFVWIIASRPEWQILSEIDKLSSSVNIWRSQLHINTPEAHEDVSTFLRNEFARICGKYSDSFTGETRWPTDAQFLTITSSANGLMLFADIVIKFVDDDNFGNPAAQLQICLEFLKGNLMPEDGNPFDPLDALYRGILSTIDRRILPVMRQVLSFLVFQGIEERQLNTQVIASFFHLDQATFYSALRRLHAVLRIPAPSDAQDEPLSFYHASFKDFLKHKFQSGGLGLSQLEMILLIVGNHLRWHIECKLEETDGKAISEMAPWISRKSFDGLARFVEKPIWKLWAIVADHDISRLRDVFYEYRFCDVPFKDRLYGSFGNPATKRLFCKLFTYFSSSWCPDRYRILRAQPEDPVDHQLLEKYAFLINARTKWAPLGPYLMEMTQNDNLLFTFVSKQDLYDSSSSLDFCRDHLWDSDSTYFFLGHSTKTVLVVASRLQRELKPYLDAVFELTFKLHSSDSEGYVWTPKRICNLIGHHIITDFGDYPNLNTDVPQPFVHCFSLATHVVAFVNDHPYHDHATRLNVMMDILSHCEPRDQDHILERLYKQITPDNLISISGHILVLLACFSFYDERFPLSLNAVSVENVGRILSVDYASLQLALRVLNPFIIRCHLPIPNSTELADFVSLNLPHESGTFRFSNLLDELEGLFFDIDGQIWLDVSARLVYYSNTFLNDTYTLPPSMANSMDCKVERSSPSILQDCSSKLSNDIVCATWVALCIAALKRPSDVATEFHKLRCCHLNRRMMNWATTEYNLLRFANTIYKLDERHSLGNLVRTQAKFDTDKQLLEKWATTKVDYELAEFPIAIIWDTVVLPLSLHYDFEDSVIPENIESCKVFLLGHGDNSCLIAYVKKAK